MRTKSSIANKRNSGERGSALVTSVVMVMFATAMGAAMLQIQSGMSVRQRESTDKKRALYIAEAGLSEGFMAVAMGKSGNVASAAQPATFGDGVFWVEAAEQPGGAIGLVSNGLCGSGRFSASMTISKEVNSIAKLGVFGDQQMTIGGSAVLDGYQSALGSFESQAHSTPVGLSTGSGASINANSNISVMGPTMVLGRLGLFPSGPNTTIYGDAHPGPSKAVTTQPYTTITGSTSPNTKPSALPDIDVPPIKCQGSVVAHSTQMKDGDFCYDSVRVPAGETLRVRGPVTVVASKFIMDPSSKIEVDTTDGPVLMYVTDCVKCSTGSQFLSVGGDPKAFGMLVSAAKAFDHDGDGVTDPPVTLNSTGNFYGVLYAPNAPVTVPSGLRIFGSVAAQKLTLANNARVTFDQSLLNCVSVVTNLPNFISWKIVELPKVPIVESRRDPNAYLRDNAIVPIKAADAHREKTLTILYIDCSGVIKSFTGLEAAFDWSQVRRPLRTNWTL